MNDHDSRFTLIAEHDDYIIVTFDGGLDSIMSEERGWAMFQQDLDALVDLSAGRTVILDIEDQWVNVCASIYNNFARLHEKLGDDLLFCNLPATAMDLLVMNQLARLLNIYSTLDQAIASISAR